jgi:hypothetical protein
MAMTRKAYLDLSDDERPHLYPDRAPSNSVYTGSKNVPGCRCVRCRAAHSEAVKNRRNVIKLEPESVIYQPIPAQAPASVPEPVTDGHQTIGLQAPEDEPELVQEAQTASAEVSVNPPAAEAVYSDPGPLTAEQVAASILKRAVNAVGPNDVLPEWMIMARSIAAMYGVPVPVAQRATAINKPYIGINAYLNGGRGAIVLLKRPGR